MAKREKYGLTVFCLRLQFGERGTTPLAKWSFFDEIEKGDLSPSKLIHVRTSDIHI